MKLSDIISKNVISLYDAESVATVLRCVFDFKLKCVKGFVVFDLDENELYLPFSNIHSIEDVIIIKNISKLVAMPFADEFLYYKKQVYDTDGKYYGEMTDIEIDETGKVNAFCFDTKKLENKNVVFAKNVVVFEGEKQICLKNIKGKSYPIIRPPQEIKVEILDKNNFVPAKVNGTINQLYGRKTTVDIIGQNNEVIARKNQVITEKIIAIAQRHNKINQLYFSSN